MYQVILLAAVRIQTNLTGRINSLANRISLAALISITGHQTTVKRTCKCCCCLNPVLNNNNVSCFIQKPLVAKLIPTRHVMNVLPRLSVLNAIKTFTPFDVSLIKSLTANKINLLVHGARSGFEPESPVHIRTGT